MRKRSRGTVVIAVVIVHMIASLACGDPIGDFFSTQAAVRDSSAATQTKTDTHRPIRTLTPSGTPNPTQIETNALATADASLLTETASTKTAPTPSERDRFLETAGLTKFSYVPPAGWKMVPDSDSDLTEWLEPSECCLLRFLVAELDVSAEEYALVSLDLKKRELHVEVISQGKFINHAGLDAYKMVMAYSIDASNQQVTQYFFQSRGYIFIATYIRAYNESKDQDAIVDASLQTLQDG